MPKAEINFTEQELNNKINKLIGDYLQSRGFTALKLSDVPIDNNSIVNRKYVNLYGSIIAAPISSVVGQQFFATDLGYPIYKHPNGRWVSSSGSIVS